MPTVRILFPFNQEARGTAAFQRIYADLSGGGITLPSLGGKRYFMVLTNDFTRYRWVFFLKKKSNALEVVTNFVAIIKT